MCGCGGNRQPNKRGEQCRSSDAPGITLLDTHEEALPDLGLESPLISTPLQFPGTALNWPTRSLTPQIGRSDFLIEA